MQFTSLSARTCAVMFRLPSAWNIQHSSSDEFEFSSSDNEPIACEPTGLGDNKPSQKTVIAEPALKEVACSATEHRKRISKLDASLGLSNIETSEHRKRTSSKLDANFDDSDIETSPRPQVHHQVWKIQAAASRASSNKAGLGSAPLASQVVSSRPAHLSASSIEEIEVDTPSPSRMLLLPKHTISSASAGKKTGWIQSISDSVLQLSSANPRGSRPKPNSRTAENVIVRQSYTAVQRNRDNLNSISHLLHSQTLTSTHSRELILLSVVSCEPCHLPVIPVRVNFCHGKSSKLLPSQSQSMLPMNNTFPPPCLSSFSFSKFSTWFADTNVLFIRCCHMLRANRLREEYGGGERW